MKVLMDKNTGNDHRNERTDQFFTDDALLFPEHLSRHRRFELLDSGNGGPPRPGDTLEQVRHENLIINMNAPVSSE